MFGWGILKRFGFVLGVRVISWVIIGKILWHIAKETMAHEAKGLSWSRVAALFTRMRRSAQTAK